jgi:hypothetical protein
VQPDLKKRAFALAGVAGALALGGFMSACTTQPTASGTQPGAPAPTDAPVVTGGEQPPPAPREFRAAWVSTVANIDWPSKQNLTAAQQQAEALAILDRAKALNLNAIVLQVRPSADAIYASRIEPWSEYLTGAQGRAPQPWYDPLKFWVTEAHARGIELHAWFNPYRARHDGARSPAAPNHITNANPAGSFPAGLRRAAPAPVAGPRAAGTVASGRMSSGAAAAMGRWWGTQRPTARRRRPGRAPRAPVGGRRRGRAQGGIGCRRPAGAAVRSARAADRSR